MMAEEQQQKPEVRFVDTRKADNRLATIGWALVLILAGIVWLLPENIVPRGAFLFGLGIILLVLNLVRYIRGQGISEPTLFVGIIAFVAGLRRLFGLRLPFIPVVLILLGAFILAHTLVKKKT